MIRSFKPAARCAAALLFTASLLASPAFAGGDEDVDIFIAQNAAGDGLVIGGAPGVDDGNFSELDITTRVFTGALFAGGVFDGTEFGFDDPGFFSLDSFDEDGITPNPFFPAGSQALPSSGTLNVSTRVFDFAGQSSEVFFYDVLNDGDTSTIEFVPVSNDFGFDTDPVNLGTSLSDTQEIGRDGDDAGEDFDFHPSFGFDTDPSATPLGIYLVSLEASLDGLANSDPIFLILPTFDTGFNESAEEPFPLSTTGESIEAALGSVEAFVASQVPEPGSALLACLGVASMLLRRRQA